MSTSAIEVRGCRVHNLRNIDVDVRRGALIVVCGLSGSGKTSLALDTLYAEGQRCYIESFSAYARQYLERLDKPDCDEINGIPPAIAVTRKGTTKTNRSTVATATDIADHVRLLFAKAADLFCHGCGNPVQKETPESTAEQMASFGESTRSMICFPVWLPSRKEASEILLGLQQEGYTRLIVEGSVFRLSDEDRAPLAKKVTRKGTEALVVVDRVTGTDAPSRLTESLETAMTEGYGRAVVLTAVDGVVDPTMQVSEKPISPWPHQRERVSKDMNGQSGPSDCHAAGTESVATESETLSLVDGAPYHHKIVSDSRRCDSCDIEYPDAVPRLFNFNHPLGACPNCEGFGDVVDYDMELVVPDTSLSLQDGAIAPWNTPSYQHELQELLDLAPDHDLPVDVPYRKLKKKHRQLILDGVPARKFGGLKGFFRWLDRKKYKMHVRIFASRFRSYRPCPVCEGKRLKPEALSYRLHGLTIADLMTMQASQAEKFLAEIPWKERQAAIAEEPVRQIRNRLGYLASVGLGYLQLQRTLRTLSGGETQRVALTSALGSNLVNMLYVLDEPTAGLHPADVERLCRSIVDLRDRGNTVLVVEHDETLIRMADRLIEIGPEAGTMGGEVVFEGTSKQMLKSKKSLTAQFLRGERGRTLTHRQPRPPRGWIRLKRATGNNLQNIDVDFPTGLLCVVTGVSGSGKSSLIHNTLFPAVAQKLGSKLSADERKSTLPCNSVTGLSGIDDVLMVDQSAISRSARSCPVTFVKAFDPIRKVFAETLEAKTRNLTPGHFSFNSEKGQCPQCEGAGILEVDMQFLADVSMKCTACQGTRFRDDILQVHYRDRSIAEVLSMTVREAYSFFRGHAKVQARLKRMIDVGLEYISLGQPATTLSSGEGQRLKLAAFLASASRRRTLFIMDEPTTGLHFADIVRLVDCFDALLADGHSLIVVEHNALLMKAADYLIDLGPGAADKGGQIVATGTPAEVADIPHSATASFVRLDD